MIGNLRMIGGGLAVIGIGLSIFLFWSHYKGLVEQNARWKQEIGRLEVGLETQGRTVDEQAAALRRWSSSQLELEQELEELRREQSRARAETSRLLNIFAEHDLENLLNERPESIVRLVNDGTDRAFRMLECASGDRDQNCPDGAVGADAASDPEATSD